MNKDLLTTLVFLSQALAWPLVVFIIALLLKNPLKSLVDRLSCAKDLQVTWGSFSIQARAMQEIKNYLDVGFPDDVISKDAIKAMIDTKIRSIDAERDRQMINAEVRTGNRKPLVTGIMIINQKGETFNGETLDVSKAGVGFRSDGRLKFNEVVQLVPKENTPDLEGSVSKALKIVRIAQGAKGFYYGSSVVGT